jgi:hypothetical protein
MSLIEKFFGRKSKRPIPDIIEDVVEEIVKEAEELGEEAEEFIESALGIEDNDSYDNP